MTLKNIFPTGPYPNALAFSPDGKLAYALHAPDAAVNVYDTLTSALVGQFSAADRGSDMIVDNTGQHLFINFDGAFNGRSGLIAYATGTVVPEPSTLILGLAALAGLGLVTVRQKFRQA